MPVELFGRLSNKLFKVMDGMGTRINFHAMMTNFTLDAIGLAGFGKMKGLLRRLLTHLSLLLCILGA